MYLNRNDWVADIEVMHDKYKAKEWVVKQFEEGNYDILRKFLAYRLDFVEEEFEETLDAFADNNPKEIVDGLIDIIVVAIGTLDLFGVDSIKVWNEIHKSNMNKEVGIKESRPNPFGMPDLVKPEGWKPPIITYEDCGILPALLMQIKWEPKKK